MTVKVFRNGHLLKDGQIVKDDLWVEDGKIIDPAELFFKRKKTYDQEIDCKDFLISAGLIDLQINGGFGVDFTFDMRDEKTARHCLTKVAKGILAHGVTSFCPTFVTSPPETYHRFLPWVTPTKGSAENGAEILGAHLEGPFIAPAKKGAHKEEFIKDITNGYQTLEEVYGSDFAKHAKIITLAPEKDPKGEVVEQCVKNGITVSLGHSIATLTEGEQAIRKGARLITHLFNAMASFHHRDPGLVGLLTSTKLDDNEVFYGIIADGIHTHPAALRIAYRTNFAALCLVTDAITAMGLSDGTYMLGEQKIKVTGEKAILDKGDPNAPETLCGAIATLWKAVQKLIKGSRCTLVEALESATLHPAQAIGIQHKKGTLHFGSDADFILIDQEQMQVRQTWIAGECVYQME